MKALFGRKVTTLQELRELTKLAKEDQMIGTLYEVVREVVLSDDEFNAFSNDMLADQPWILKSDGGSNDKGELRCIRVVNETTGEKVILDTEGHSYGRYSALEE